MTPTENKLIQDSVSYVRKQKYGFRETESLFESIFLRNSILKTLKESDIIKNNSISLGIDQYNCISEEQSCKLLNKIKTIC